MNQSILSKLEQLSMRLEEINALLSDQSIASDQNMFRELSIEHSQLTPVNDKYKEYLSTVSNINAAEKLLDEEDGDIKEMAQEEITSGQEILKRLELSFLNDLSISITSNELSIILLCLNLPLCLFPRLIDGILKNGDSIIPLEELPIINLEYLRRL